MDGYQPTDEEAKNMNTPNSGEGQLKMEIVILSSPILVEDGEFARRTISLDLAKKIIDRFGCEVYSSHETVKLLNLTPDTSRRQCDGYDMAIILSPKARLQFGREYSVEEIESIGYDVILIHRTTLKVVPDGYEERYPEIDMQFDWYRNGTVPIERLQEIEELVCHWTDWIVAVPDYPYNRVLWTGEFYKSRKDAAAACKYSHVPMTYRDFLCVDNTQGNTAYAWDRD